MVVAGREDEAEDCVLMVFWMMQTLRSWVVVMGLSTGPITEPCFTVCKLCLSKKRTVYLCHTQIHIAKMFKNQSPVSLPL